MNTRIELYLTKSAAEEQSTGVKRNFLLPSLGVGAVGGAGLYLHHDRKVSEAARLARKGFGRKLVGGGLGVAALGGVGLGLKHMLASGGEKAVQGLKETAAVERKAAPIAEYAPKPRINTDGVVDTAQYRASKEEQLGRIEKADKDLKLKIKEIKEEHAKRIPEGPRHESPWAQKAESELLRTPGMEDDDKGGLLHQAVMAGKRALTRSDSRTHAEHIAQIAKYHEGADALRSHLQGFDYPYNTLDHLHTGQPGRWSGTVVGELVGLHGNMTDGKPFNMYEYHRR